MAQHRLATEIADLAPGRPISQETILSPSHDPFFANHLFANFGDLGASLATYVKEFQSKSLASNPAAIETVADMKRFVEEYPEFKKLGGNVSKHVALVGELSRIVERDGLLAVSEVEQSLASNESHTADLKVGPRIILRLSVCKQVFEC